VTYQGRPLACRAVADRLTFKKTRQVSYRGKQCGQWVAQAEVTLTRPAKPSQKKGKRPRVPGVPVSALLVVSRILCEAGQVLAQWLLLTNVNEAPPDRIALWYYWRWQIGVSGEGHIIQSVQVRPRLRDSSLVAGEAAWRESKTLKPSDNAYLGCAATHQVATCSERRGSLVTRTPVAETVDNARRQQGPTERSPIRRSSPAGYQRRHDAKDYGSTGEALGARRRKLAEEVVPITVSGKWSGRHQGGGSGRSTKDRRAAKRAGREGPGPIGNLFVQSEVGVR
jgi:hypothetical protein